MENEQQYKGGRREDFKNVFYVCTRLKVKGNETFRNMVKNKASKQKGREK